ncbi:MAG: hypothetical protein INR69_02840 [Mucilaginibacter polytrichastri]|nr:hypothetical protein [Mucilaginibacter polytrichastri]
MNQTLIDKFGLRFGQQVSTSDGEEIDYVYKPGIHMSMFDRYGQPSDLVNINVLKDGLDFTMSFQESVLMQMPVTSLDEYLDHAIRRHKAGA